MWNYDEFVAKAKLYFLRASERSRADDEFTFWLLLGSEFLLRAPLAQKGSFLLAVPEGPSLMHAAGYTSATSEPKSIPYKTVCERLKIIIPEFSKVYDDAMYLANVRNEELHSSNSTLANLHSAAWMPRFLRVVEVIASHLTLPVETLIDSEIIEHARSLANEEDARIQRTVSQKIAAAKDFYSKLLEAEVESRRILKIPATRGRFYSTAECPACEEKAFLFEKVVRSTRERVVDDAIENDQIMVSTDFQCLVCGLTLGGMSEVRIAKLETERVVTWTTEPEERFEIEPQYIEPEMEEEYGND
ncbi:hypothetical protein [Streptomyces sp. NPDC050392]|uniref:hypothetical protein n=1 Tax=Streptomyces sp. NPDC050392 TaxID=3155782 RepID=UPI003449D9D2